MRGTIGLWQDAAQGPGFDLVPEGVGLVWSEVYRNLQFRHIDIRAFFAFLPRVNSQTVVISCVARRMLGQNAKFLDSLTD